MLKLAGAVEAVQSWQLPGMGGSDKTEDGAGGEEGSHGKASKGEEERRSMKESEEQLQQYKPRIPGAVLYIYRSAQAVEPSFVSKGRKEGRQALLPYCGHASQVVAAPFYTSLNNGVGSMGRPALCGSRLSWDAWTMVSPGRLTCVPFLAVARRLGGPN